MLVLRDDELQVGLVAVQLANLVLERSTLLIRGLLDVNELLVQLVALFDDPFVFGLQRLLLYNDYAQKTYVSTLGANLRLQPVVDLLQLVECLSRLEVVVQQFLHQW